MKVYRSFWGGSYWMCPANSHFKTHSNYHSYQIRSHFWFYAQLRLIRPRQAHWGRCLQKSWIEKIVKLDCFCKVASYSLSPSTSWLSWDSVELTKWCVLSTTRDAASQSQALLFMDPSPWLHHYLSILLTFNSAPPKRRKLSIYIHAPVYSFPLIFQSLCVCVYFFARDD